MERSGDQVLQVFALFAVNVFLQRRPIESFQWDAENLCEPTVGEENCSDRIQSRGTVIDGLDKRAIGMLRGPQRHHFYAGRSLSRGNVHFSLAQGFYDLQGFLDGSQILVRARGLGPHFDGLVLQVGVGFPSQCRAQCRA